MKHAAGIRRSLGIRTIFNMLGPLANPAGAEFQLMGVFSKDLPLKLPKYWEPWAPRKLGL